MALTDAQLEQAVQQFTNAVGKGNTAAAQELIRQWNLTYTNDVADKYGQNFGVGQPAPAGAGTLAQGQATGGIGYIPGFSGLDASQSMAMLSGQASTAQGAAGLTGFYTAPSQSQYTPGTFVRLDPNTYDTSTYGPVQISYVLPSGQLQRVNIPQAQAMGWNGNLGTMNVLAAQTAMALEQAPPSQLPQQTLQGLTGYSNLNTAAMNNAIAQSGVTGYYNSPAPVQPPGTNWGGGKFSDLPPEAQRAYYVSNGGDWNAAMNKWVADSNAAIQAAGGSAPTAGKSQETMARELQTYTEQMGMIKQAADLQANPFRQQQAIGQMGNLLGGRGVAGFSAPNTVAGVGTMGQGGYGSPQTMSYATGGGQTGMGAAPGSNQMPGAQQPGGAGTMSYQGAAGTPGSDLNNLAGWGSNQPTGAGTNYGGTPYAPGSGGGYGQTQTTSYGGGTGMSYLQQMLDDIRNPAANQASMNSILDAIPTPTKLNSTEFMRAAPSTQNMVLQGMQEKYGLDPTDSMAQIKNTLPQFTAPTTMGSVKR